MRPNSRGQLNSSAGFQAPGTGMNRPGSSQRLGTGRLRTGAVPSGPGTQAAQGMALSANINVSGRPVTGQGMMGMKTNVNTGRLVEDSAYYIGQLRQKITFVEKETDKLREDIDQSSKDNRNYTSLEQHYEKVSKEKEDREGQLADYNLALDKSRHSTAPEDVMDMAEKLKEENDDAGRKLDEIFMKRKKKEQDTKQREAEITKIYESVKKKIRDLDYGKVNLYEDLLKKQQELQEKNSISEKRLEEITYRIRQFEEEDSSSILRKQFQSLLKKCTNLSRDVDSLQEELDITNLEPKEAISRFSARVNSFREKIDRMDDRSKSLREDIETAKKRMDELDRKLSDNHGFEDAESVAKEEEKMKKIHQGELKMKEFIAKYPQTKEDLLTQQQEAKFVIVQLLESISKGLDDTENMPTREEHAEMSDAKQFKEKNLKTAQETMDTLYAEKRKREKEIKLLRDSEPKLEEQTNQLRTNISLIRNDIEMIKDPEIVKRAFEVTKANLLELKQSYINRKDSMRQQISTIQSESEHLKKEIASHYLNQDMNDQEKKIRLNEKKLFELKGRVESKLRETDYDSLKLDCLRMVDKMNKALINEYQ